MCVAPVMVRDKTGVSAYAYINVPCGKCYECRSRRSAAWAFRLMQEERCHSSSHFITLTYSDDQLTFTDDGATLVKEDLQKYFKRIRKNSGKLIKYYACGEYGSTTLRPHYHSIVFGASDRDLENNWKSGNVFFGEVSPLSVRYVTNYLCKSVHTDFGNRAPEFALMSKGLGKAYITDAMIDWHHNHMADYVVNLGGTRQALPRYYREKIFDESQRRQLAVESANRVEERYNNAVAKLGVHEYEYQNVQRVMQTTKREILKQKNRNKL